jgi:hypothetical protein
MMMTWKFLLTNHLKFIRSLPCVKCRQTYNVQAAHLRKGTDGGMGKKPSDCYTVPLCFKCHNLQHNKGEVTFWGDTDKVKELALYLFKHTGDIEKCIKKLLSF